MLERILKRWRSKGGSSYDPCPTLAHHLVHILGACLFGSWISHLSISNDFMISIGVLTSLFIVWIELIQIIGGATVSDSIFDIWQYQCHWAWYFTPITGVIIFSAWLTGYLIMLIKFLDEDGNPV